MTDNDIIKTLESIASEAIGDCKRDCAFYDGKVHYCAGIVAKNSLDLINRQKAEVERLKVESANIVARTLKKFVKKLDEHMGWWEEPDGYYTRFITLGDFAELVKEMTGEQR